MTEEEIRKQLEKELGASFRAATWRWLKAGGAVREFQQGDLTLVEDEDPWDYLKSLAEEQLRYQRELYSEFQEEANTIIGSVGGGATEDTREAHEREPYLIEQSERHLDPPALSSDEILRAEIFEEYLANLAADDSGVQRFRTKTLGGRLLTLEQALALVQSPAAQAFELGLFKKWGIPVVGHSATLEAYTPDVPGDRSDRHRATISVDPPGIAKQVWSRSDKRRRFETLRFVDQSGRTDECKVWGRSILGELARVSSRLIEHFPWQEAQATWLVLTGQPPAVPPVRVRYRLEEDNIGEERHYKHGVVTLTVTPWVSERTLRQAYRDIQSRILGTTNNRQLGTKRLRLLRFVTEQIGSADPSRGDRRQLGRRFVEQWDEENPHWTYGKYRKPTSVFWRDYDQVKHLVVSPDYRRPHEIQSDNNGSSSGSSRGGKRR